MKAGDIVKLLPYDSNFPEGKWRHSLSTSTREFITGCIGRTGPYSIVDTKKTDSTRYVKIAGRDGKLVTLKASYFVKVEVTKKRK